MEGLTILGYPGAKEKGLITQNNVNSTCIRTVSIYRAETTRGTGHGDVDNSTSVCLGIKG